MHAIVYGVSQGPQVVWRAVSGVGPIGENPNVLMLLDAMGRDGWVVVASGDFFGGGKTELLLRR